jgi:hypothetical protein
MIQDGSSEVEDEMRRGLKSVALAGLAALGLGSAAQASELSITISGGGFGVHRPVADYDSDERFGGRRHREHDRFEHREPDRFYGRPVPEWRDRPSRWDRPHGVRVVQRHGWAEDCRIVVRDRFNRWGERVQIRKQICR